MEDPVAADARLVPLAVADRPGIAAWELRERIAATRSHEALRELQLARARAGAVPSSSDLGWALETVLEVLRSDERERYDELVGGRTGAEVLIVESTSTAPATFTSATAAA